MSNKVSLERHVFIRKIQNNISVMVIPISMWYNKRKKNKSNYSEPHSQNRLYEAFLLHMWSHCHIKQFICLNKQSQNAVLHGYE